MLVEATSSYESLSFMDGYSGYNYIKMHHENDAMTAFCSPMRVFCYLIMQSSLKSAKATTSNDHHLQGNAWRHGAMLYGNLEVKSLNRTDQL